MAAACSSFRLNMMRMMMAAGSTVFLLLLCCSFAASTDSKKCDRNAVKGASFIVPLDYTLAVSDHLKWMRDDNVVFRRRGTKDPNPKIEDVNKDGSLKLENVDDSKGGLYTNEVFDSNGKLKKQGAIHLCVIEPLPKPTVKFSCDSAPDVKFTCTVGKMQPDLKYEWMMDNVTVPNQSSRDLKKASKDVKNKAIRCKVLKNDLFEVSTEVKDVCKSESASEDFFQKLFTDYIWYVVGGGAGVVVLLILIVILCCIRAKRRDRLQLKEEEELRLGWTNTDSNHHHQCSRPADQHRHAHQQPAGHTGPRQHRPKQNPDQQRPRVPNNHPQPTPRRPAQAPRPPADDDEQPPPLPQPRKKSQPKTPRA